MRWSAHRNGLSFRKGADLRRHVHAPDKPDDPCQVIDSRDLAAWTIRMVEMREFGTYNAIVARHR